MRNLYLSVFLFHCIHILGAQIMVTGSVFDSRSKKPIFGAELSIEGTQAATKTDANGHFNLGGITSAAIVLVHKNGFITQRLPITFQDQDLDLGTIYLERDVTIDQRDNLITLTDSELLDDEVRANSLAMLQATQDVFLNRAAFDFGQAFFRVRGYDSRNGKVLINGIAMNKLYDGRPQWNNWGGLNDVTRNQQFSNGLAAADLTFGDLLGSTNIDTRPSGLRAGTRVSTAASNRTYVGRLMATHNSGLKKNGFAYSVSGSRRWANQGYIEGTLYDAFSFFAAVEYRFHEKNTIQLTGIFAQNRRGRSSAITEEVFELVGERYNPYWGEQNGKIRNSRERKIVEPVVLLNHYLESGKFNLNTGIAYQFGTNARSRLGYYNAPNPDPTYYRYLPSFYVNSPIGANFESADLARAGFLESPQLDWNTTYAANKQGQAAYLLYDDVTDDKQLIINSLGNWTMAERFQLDFGVLYKKLTSVNYAQISDLLDADFHLDIDPFSNTLNDLNGEAEKTAGDAFGYRYQIEALQLNAFTQLRYTGRKWDAFMAARYSTSDYGRDGIFKNERFAENSLGKSEKVQFDNYGVKGGLTYKFNGRHWVSTHALYQTKAPFLQNVFINPRENNEVVPDIQSETVSSADVNYFIRLPKLTGRITGFYSRFQHTTDINFFFVDAGVGSDFVQEVLTGLDKLHLGAELGLEYQLSSAVRLTAVAALGKYVYASDPNVTINFDTAGAAEDVIDPEGNIDLGLAQIKDYKLAQGPQQAFALGIDYRDPTYWWISAKMNYLADNYPNISTITRTNSFYLDPETGQPFPDATPENIAGLLEQKKLDDFYLLNLVGGKSWLKKGKYISVFASVNNLFDTVFRTGGYEQSRNGNYGQLRQDSLSGTPSFAPKYWYGFGRTYFLNVAYSF